MAAGLQHERMAHQDIAPAFDLRSSPHILPRSPAGLGNTVPGKRGFQPAKPLRCARPAQRRTKARRRRLAFETCEPRLLLAAMPALLPDLDWAPADEPPWSEVADRTCDVSFAVPVRDWPSSGDADVCPDETTRAAGPSEIQASDGDPRTDSTWISLDAGPDPTELFTTLGEWPDMTVDDSLALQPFAQRPGPMTVFGAEDPVVSADPRRLAALSAISDAATDGQDAASQRRQWTNAETVRYPWHDGLRPERGAEEAFPGAPTAVAAGFLDVGRTVTPAPHRALFRSGPGTPTELASVDGLAASLGMNSLTEGLAAARPTRTPSAAASGHRTTLTGENRSQRMMLLASPSLRPRIPEPAAAAMAPYLPLDEMHPIQTPSDGPTGAPLDKPEPARPPRDAVGILSRPAGPVEPSAADRASRSTLGGLAVLFVLAADWFYSVCTRASKQTGR